MCRPNTPTRPVHAEESEPASASSAPFTRSGRSSGLPSKSGFPGVPARSLTPSCKSRKRGSRMVRARAASSRRVPAAFKVCCQLRFGRLNTSLRELAMPSSRLPSRRSPSTSWCWCWDCDFHCSSPQRAGWRRRWQGCALFVALTGRARHGSAELRACRQRPVGRQLALQRGGHAPFPFTLLVGPAICAVWRGADGELLPGAVIAVTPQPSVDRQHRRALAAPARIRHFGDASFGPLKIVAFVVGREGGLVQCMARGGALGRIVSGTHQLEEPVIVVADGLKAGVQHERAVRSMARKRIFHLCGRHDTGPGEIDVLRLPVRPR